MYNCKQYAEIKKRNLYQKIRTLSSKPRLVVIQIGNNPSSNSYIKGKERDCNEVGIDFVLMKMPENVGNKALRNTIINLNMDDSVNGIILQLPVPKHIDIKEIQNTIISFKDVDGFNKNSKFKPCTPKGIIDWLKYDNYDFEGKTACVIGRSDIVGKPLSKMLLEENTTVIQCHSKTTNNQMYKLNNQSDIVFTCIDKIEYFKNGFNFNQDIIDIGLGIGEDGKLHGNIEHNYLEYLKHNNNNIIVSGIGGVGLLTRIALLENVYNAYIMQNER